MLNTKNGTHILLYCLGKRSDELRPSALESLSPSQWNNVILRSERHNVAPLFYHSLRDSGLHRNVPPDAAQKLKDIYFRSAIRNLRLYNELSSILRLLQEEGIPVIVLKGAHLAEEIYGNTALRTMGDVDLLVKKTELGRVEEVFVELGYGSANRPRVEEQCERRHHIITFRTRNGLPIEVHWNIARPSSPFKIDVHALWRRARPATIADVQVKVLSPEDLIAHLCLHEAYHHRFSSGLRAFCDIRETLARYKKEIDWQLLESTIRRSRSRNCTYLSLFLSHQVLKTEVPGNVIARTRRDPLMRYLSTMVTGKLFSDNNTSLSIREKLIWHFKIRDRLGDRLRYLLYFWQTLRA